MTVPQVHGHVVVTPSQVTCPNSLGQLGLTAVQLVVLLLPWQEMVVNPQFTEALQRALVPIPVAANEASLGPDAQEPGTAGAPRIAARASPVRRAWLGVGVRASVRNPRAQATIHAFFICSSF
jgi:hypothetical protein